MNTVVEDSPLRHNTVFGILLILYGGIHLLAFAFFLTIVLAVSGGGVYYRALDAVGTFFLLGTPLLAALPALVAGYGLMRRRAWAATAVVIAAVAQTLVATTIALQASRPQLTPNRMIIITLFCVVSIAIWLYSIWLLRNKSAV
jgi:hypothetical protein